MVIINLSEKWLRRNKTIMIWNKITKFSEKSVRAAWFARKLLQELCDFLNFNVTFGVYILKNTYCNPLGPNGSYMIHGSDGRNNCPEAKGLVDNTNFLSTKKLIARLNVDRPLLIYQR